MSCSTTVDDSLTPHISSNCIIKLLPPASFKPERTETHRVKIDSGNSSFKFTGVVEFSSENISVVGLTGLQHRLFSIVFDGVNLEMESQEYFQLKVPQHYLIADLQSIFSVDLPESPGCRWEKDTNRRQLLKADREIVRIDYIYKNSDLTKIEYKHIERGYTIEINYY